MKIPNLMKTVSRRLMTANQDRKGSDLIMIYLRNKYMNKIYCALMVISSLSLPVLGEKPYQYRAADINQIRNQSNEAVMIMPVSFLREYDPVTIMYNRDMHKEGSGSLDNPDQYVTIKPSQPGEYRWLDPRTIEFRPSIPWKAMQTYIIKSGETNRTLAVLLMPPSNINPSSGSTNLDPVSKVSLEFSQQISPDVLAKLVTFETCPLPGIETDNCKSLNASDYTIKMSERTSRDSYTYIFTFKRPVPNGLRIRTIVHLTSDPALSDAKRVYYFDTRKEFTIERAGTYEYQFTLNPAGNTYGRDQAIRLSQDGTLIFDFSDQPVSLTLSQVKSLLNFSPAPRRLDWSLSDTRLTVRLSVEQEKLYNVSISPIAIHDKDGRVLQLKRQCSFFCYQPRDRQFVRWGLGNGLLERFGPQHFPLLVSGVKSIDVRVYKIDPLHKAFWPFPNYPVSVNEDSRPPSPGEEPTLEENITSPLNSYEMAGHIKMLGSPHFTGVIDLDREGVSRFQSIDLKPLFTKVNGLDRPGAYLVGFRTLDGSVERSYIRVQVTDLCLSTVEAKNQVLFTVTSYSNGRPVSDADIMIEGLSDNKFKTLGQGKTNQQGMFVLEHSESLQKAFLRSSVKRVIVSRQDDMLVLDSRESEAPPLFANNHWYSSNSSWLEWLSNDRYDFRNDRRPAGFVFTERPIYRPNEPVYLKGYIRSLYHGTIDKPESGATYTLRILSPSGSQFDSPIKLSNYLSFNDSLVEKDLPTGDYQVQVLQTVPDQGEKQLATTSFKIEAYRIPKFQVKLFGPEKTPNDQPATVWLSASYYAGGKVSQQNVSWKVTSFPYSYIPESLAGWIMSTDNRYGAVDEERRQGNIEQNDVTGDDGQDTIVINTQSATNGNARKYICEATVTDVDEQTVSNRISFLALPPFALALKVDRYISGSSKIKASIGAINIGGKFETGHKISVQLKKMSWISYLQETDFSRGKPKYLTQESVDLISERTVTTVNTPLEIKFDDQDPGVYILEISSRDKLGRLQLVKADLFLSGNKPVTWKKGDQLIFETVSDKDSYEPGQQAKILLKSPFQRGMALAVTEQPGGIPDYQWVEISDGQGTFSFTITPEMAPRIPVSFLLMRPRISDEKRTPDGLSIDAGKPQTIANTTWLKIEQIDNILNVSLDHPQTVRPGSEVNMTIHLKDGRGKPESGEVALWLVDEAVLSLAKEKSLDPLPSFTDQVSSHISLRDSRNMVLGNLRLPETPGGDGSEGEDEVFGKVTVRKNFKTVPYWNPSIPVDKSGNATVNFKISDDLTDFAVRAVAVSGTDRFGFGKSQVRVRLPVIIQPMLPRFVRPGDKIAAGGVARVVEGPGGSASYSIQTQGLKIIDGTGSADVNLDSKKPMPIQSNLLVLDAGFDSTGHTVRDSVKVKMLIVRRSDNASDAFEVNLPLKSDRQMIYEDVFADVTPGKAFSIPATPKVRPNTLMRQLLVSDNLSILKAVSAMTSLVQYPHGCAEQMVSRAYPSVVYRNIWSRFGVESPNPSVKKDVAVTIDYLTRTQNEDGLFGYWPGTAGYVYLTAYIVEFLTEVKRANETANAGYLFNKEMYEKAITALKRSLRSDYSRFVDGRVYFERSAALLALAKAGQIDIGYARELASQTNEVDLQSQSRIYEALLKNSGALDSELKSLGERIWNQTVFKLEAGKEVFGGLQQRSFFIGSRVHTDEITALASMVNAFSLSPKRPPKLQMLVDELVSLGGNDGWGSTQTNSVALLALRNVLENPIKNEKFTGNLVYNNTTVPLTGDGKNGTVTYKWYDPSKSVFNIESVSGKEPVHVRYSQRYLPLEPGSKAPAMQKGFVVKRELLFVENGSGTRRMWLDSAGVIQKIKTGDIIEEHIQVQNPKDRYFVAVSAPFAAGLEYMNPRLETSGEDAKPQGKTTCEGDYQAFLDDQVVYYFEHMNSGTYDFYFRVRATVEGEYSHPSARAEAMYDMKTFGCSPGAKIVVQAGGK
jgi:uncharacterized protein YfaS (alpha-2-macroglobulin family)